MLTRGAKRSLPLSPTTWTESSSLRTVVNWKGICGCGQPCLSYLRTLKLTNEAFRQYSRLSLPILSPDAQSVLLARLVKELQARTRAKRDAPR